MPTSTTEATARPTEPAPEPPTTRFGPWMVVEKRPRRPQPKEAVVRDISSSVTITESRFAPILDANTDDLLPPERHASINAPSPLVPVMEFTGPTTNQDATPIKYSKTKSVSFKKSSATLKSKIKSSTAVQQAANFNVRKPSKTSTVVKHSAVSLSENSNPNIQNVDPSLMVNNGVGEPPKKPPDPTMSAPPKTSHAQDSISDSIQHDASSVDPTMINDANGSAMVE
ncbi:hypothetical protein V6N13_032365 [Hibiscus sabdariffa]